MQGSLEPYAGDFNDISFEIIIDGYDEQDNAVGGLIYVHTKPGPRVKQDSFDASEDLEITSPAARTVAAHVPVAALAGKGGPAAPVVKSGAALAVKGTRARATAGSEFGSFMEELKGSLKAATSAMQTPTAPPSAAVGLTFEQQLQLKQMDLQIAQANLEAATRK